MGSNTNNAYGLKSGANKLEEVNITYLLMSRAIADISLLKNVGLPTNPAPEVSKSYDYSTATDVVITGDTDWHDINELVTDYRSVGSYELKLSNTATYDSTSRSFLIRWSIDGGSTWETFSTEPKDVTDRKASSYVFPYNHTGGVFDIRVQGKCERANNTLHVYFNNIIVDQKTF